MCGITGQLPFLCFIYYLLYRNYSTSTTALLFVSTWIHIQELYFSVAGTTVQSFSGNSHCNYIFIFGNKQQAINYDYTILT